MIKSINTAIKSCRNVRAVGRISQQILHEAEEKIAQLTNSGLLVGIPFTR